MTVSTLARSLQAAVLTLLVAAAGCTVKNSSSGSSSSTCAADSTVTCTQGSGWSCTGKDSPADNNPLVCSTATVSASGDKVDFCCVASSGVTSGCMEMATITANCAQGATGFQCAGSQTPDQTDTSLLCSTGTTDGSNLDYCCLPNSQTTTTCMQDSTVMGCQSGSYGFSCTGTDMPQRSGSSLNCSNGVAGNNGETLYCCTL